MTEPTARLDPPPGVVSAVGPGGRRCRRGHGGRGSESVVVRAAALPPPPARDDRPRRARHHLRRRRARALGSRRTRSTRSTSRTCSTPRPRSVTIFFGTDEIGRDYLSRVIYGIRTSEQVGLVVAVASTLFGLIMGAIAGYYRGWADNLIMRMTDLFLDYPRARDAARDGSAARRRQPVAHHRDPRRLLLDADRPYRARSLPVAAREGVRRGREGRRRGRPPDHVPAHPSEHARPDHRQRDAHGRATRSSPRRSSRSSARGSSRLRRRSECSSPVGSSSRRTGG